METNKRPASRRQRDDLVMLAHVRSAYCLSHETYMTATLTAIVNGHKQSRVGKLLPWSFIARKDLPKKSLLGKGRRTQLEVTLPWCRVTRFDERPRCRCNKCILHWQPCPFLGSHVAVAGQVGLDEAGADRIHDDAGLFQFLVQLDR